MNEPKSAERPAQIRADRMQATPDEWEYAHVYSDFDGTPKPRRVDEQTFRAHKPDGHRADGSPYWNYTRAKRRKAGPWVPIIEQS